MVVTLGKRKRVARPAPAPLAKRIDVQEEEASDQEDLQAAFRKAFEAKFKPLPGILKEERPKPEAQVDEDQGGDDGDEGSDWSGISEPEDAVEVIEHTSVARAHDDGVDRAALKAFMSSKPPTDASPLPSNQNSKRKADHGGAPDDQDDLKNDLALQRLLKESHLLDGSFSSTDPSGKNRHKATDMRLLDLGSKSSIFTQKKMPLSHRRGILQKASQKEETRRREAKENGVILERAQFNKPKGPAPQRERNVGGPAVGKFRGGTLTLSKRDVAGITGPKKQLDRKKSKGKQR